MLVFQDEVHFIALTTVTKVCSPADSVMKIKSLSGHDKILYSGFVVLKPACFFMDKHGCFNYETVPPLSEASLLYMH